MFCKVVQKKKHDRFAPIQARQAGVAQASIAAAQAAVIWIPVPVAWPRAVQCPLLKRSFICRKIVDRKEISGKNNRSFASEYDSLKKPPNR